MVVFGLGQAVDVGAAVLSRRLDCHARPGRRVRPPGAPGTRDGRVAAGVLERVDGRSASSGSRSTGPSGPLAAGYLASAHALQFLMLALVAPPLMLLAARRPLAAAVPAAGRGRAVAMFLTQPIIAGVLFNLITITTHVPSVVDRFMPTQLGAFAIDTLWFAGGLVLWWPLVVDAPQRAWFSTPVRMLYLFLGTLVHTGIAMVMLVSQFPMYGIYELAPPWEIWSPLEDQHLAGGVMELAGAAIIFGIITVMFFRWSGGLAGDNAPKAPPRD